MKLLYNAEVMRWHIKVAKAAGYTAFLVSVFPGVTFDHATVRARFLTMLQVASEEDFKLGMELWFPLDTSNATYYSHAQGTIDAANASPHASALYKINNLPVVWLVFWSRWDTVSNLTSYLLNTRQAYWVISGDLSFAELNSMTLTNGAPGKIPAAVDALSGRHSETIASSGIGRCLLGQGFKRRMRRQTFPSVDSGNHHSLALSEKKPCQLTY
jgi:hypothetical protein